MKSIIRLKCRFHRIILPTSCWTFIGILAPFYLGLVSKRHFLRNPVSAPLQWFAVSAFFGALTNSVVWRCCESSMMEKSHALKNIVIYRVKIRLKNTISAFMTLPLPKRSHTSRGFCKLWTLTMKLFIKNDRLSLKINTYQSIHLFLNPFFYKIDLNKRKNNAGLDVEKTRLR